MNKKGILGLWIWVLICVFLVGVVYIVMARPFNVIHDKFVTGGNLTADEAVTASHITKAWNAWPMLFIMLAAVVMIVGSIKNQGPPDPGYY